MPASNKPFRIMYGSQENWTNVSISDGTLYMVTQPAEQGSSDRHVLAYVDLGSTRYAVGAPIPNEVENAISLKYPLTFSYEGNQLATAKTISYRGGNNGVVMVSDNWVITDSASGSTSSLTDISTNGSIYLNRVVSSKIGTANAVTDIVSSVNIVGAGTGGGTTVTFDAANNAVVFTTNIPTTLPNQYALTFSDGTTNVSYNGSAARTITAATLGAALATDNITSASIANSTVGGNTVTVLTLTKQGGTTVTADFPSSLAVDITGNAATATVADHTTYAVVFTDDASSSAAPGASFNGAANRVVSYETVGAAPASNISMSAIDWTSGTVPITAIPESAIERLYVAPAATSGQTNAQAAAAYLATNTDITDGDVIQVGDGGELFFVYTENNEKTVKGFSAGIAAQAQTVAHALKFVAGQGTSNNATGFTWNGSNTPEIGYATVGALGANETAVAATIAYRLVDASSNNYSLGASNGVKFVNGVPVALDGVANATEADHTKYGLTFQISSTSTTFNGGAARSISYTTNSELDYLTQIGTWNVNGTSVPFYSGMFWSTFDS